MFSWLIAIMGANCNHQHAIRDTSARDGGLFLARNLLRFWHLLSLWYISALSHSQVVVSKFPAHPRVCPVCCLRKLFIMKERDDFHQSAVKAWFCLVYSPVDSERWGHFFSSIPFSTTLCHFNLCSSHINCQLKMGFLFNKIPPPPPKILSKACCGEGQITSCCNRKSLLYQTVCLFMSFSLVYTQVPTAHSWEDVPESSGC